MRAKRCDFHMHTILSDGELLPMELIRRAAVSDHGAIALTDHASFSNIDWVVEGVIKDCAKADAWGIEAVPGVELTHIPVRHIDEAVRISRKAGAELILVHGETPVEPVEKGTNHAAVSNAEVDMLAHPGMISLDDAELALENDIYLEVTCRKGHSLANGHVVAMSLETGAKMLVNTDLHSSEDLTTMEFANRVARGAGMTPEDTRSSLVENPKELLRRLGRL